MTRVEVEILIPDLLCPPRDGPTFTDLGQVADDFNPARRAAGTLCDEGLLDHECGRGGRTSAA
jgi:hypothetical protein